MGKPHHVQAEKRNIKLVVAYNGSRYHGWQRQADGLPTVQAALEGALQRVVGHPVTVNGAGRTDAGVHALGQVANFFTSNLAIPLANLRRAADSRCPPDIGVLSAEEVGPDFHASRSAVGKTYRYRIYIGAAKPVARAEQVYHCRCPLEAEPMAFAARRLLGRHDFRGFASSAETRQNTVRTITRCEVTNCEDELHVTISGDGFLYKMVRNIVGVLVEIGRGRWDADRIDLIFSSGDRRHAGPTAPASGLCLMHVAYPPGLSREGR